MYTRVCVISNDIIQMILLKYEMPMDWRVVMERVNIIVSKTQRAPLWIAEYNFNYKIYQ